MLRLGVLGTMAWDRIYARDGRSVPVEEWGGITYALAGAAAAGGPDWQVVPIVKVGADALDDLFLLREADNVGSGLARDAGRLTELRARVARQLDSGAALDLRSLAVDGTDLMTEFGWQPGPIVGATLQRLLDRVIGDPKLNTRDRLLSVARSIVAADARS